MRRLARFGSWMAALAGAACSGASPATGGAPGDSGGTTADDGGMVGNSGDGGGGAEAGSGPDAGAAGEASSGGDTGTTGSAPEAFTLVSPLLGSSAQPLAPTLQWNASANADSYLVEVAPDAMFGAADIVHQSVSAPTTDLLVGASALTAGVVYSWRVTAVNGGGSTVATGAPWRFSSPYQVRGAHGIAVTPDGSKIVVASDINNGPIDIISLSTHSIAASIQTGVASQPMGVAVSPDGTQALATLLTNGSSGIDGVAEIDLTANAVTRTVTDPCVATTLSDVAYFPSGTEAAIPDLSSSCTAMGLTTFAPAASPGFAFVNFNDTNNPTGVAISPNGALAIVTMQLDHKVYKVTFPSTVTPISISSTSAGVAITPDGAKAVVAGSVVDVITLADDSVTTIPLMNDTPGGDFHNVAVTPDGTKAVVVGAASVQVISLTSSTVLGSYPATGGTGVAVSSDGKTAFVSDQGNGWVRVVQIP